MEKTIIVSVPVVFKGSIKNPKWFLVKKNDEKEWELPKTMTRRGESSVRAAIRMMSEQGGFRASVIEEVGRSGGATKVNGRPVSQRYLYYLMTYRVGGEVLGFEEAEWMEHSKALKKLGVKRDKDMLKTAKKMLKTVEIKEDNPPAEEEFGK